MALTWSDLNHRPIKICTACWQPAVDHLYGQTRNKLPSVLQLRRCTLHPPRLQVHELNSSASNYTVRSPLSHSVDPSTWSLVRGPSSQLALSKFWASACANLKYTCSFISVQFKFPVYGDMQTDIHTHVPHNAIMLVWDSLRLAQTKWLCVVKLCCHFTFIAIVTSRLHTGSYKPSSH